MMVQKILNKHFEFLVKIKCVFSKVASIETYPQFRIIRTFL